MLLPLLVLSGCIPAWSYAKGAPPVEKTVALVESDARVAAALGSDVSVSLAVAKELERDWLNAKVRGRDRVVLLTTAKGSTGEAQLDLDATNVDNQGWAGRWELRQVGKQVLRDGAYVTDGGGVLLAGTFSPDGAPIVKP